MLCIGGEDGEGPEIMLLRIFQFLCPIIKLLLVRGLESAAIKTTVVEAYLMVTHSVR
jgi:hypothetical protein